MPRITSAHLAASNITFPILSARFTDIIRSILSELLQKVSTKMQFVTRKPSYISNEVITVFSLKYCVHQPNEDACRIFSASSICLQIQYENFTIRSPSSSLHIAIPFRFSPDSRSFHVPSSLQLSHHQ